MINGLYIDTKFRLYSQASRADFSLELKLRRRDLNELRFICNRQLREQVEIHVGRNEVGWQLAQPKAIHRLL
jgi:hypothetical protein